MVTISELDVHDDGLVAMAARMKESSADVVIAPDFDAEALEIITGKWKNVRLLR